MTNYYIAAVEVSTRVNTRAVQPDDFDRIIETLVSHDPAVSVSSRGWLTVTLTLRSRSLARAVTNAVLLVEQATSAEVVAVEAMPEGEYLARLPEPSVESNEAVTLATLAGLSGLPSEQIAPQAGDAPTASLLTVVEVAEFLGISASAVRARIKKRQLPSVQKAPGHPHLVPARAVMASARADQ